MKFATHNKTKPWKDTSFTPETRNKVRLLSHLSVILGSKQKHVRGRQDGGDVGGCVFALQGNKGEVVI